MTDIQPEPTDADRAADDDREAQQPGEPAADDEQEIAVDAAVAEGEDDPEPAAGEQ